MLRHKNLRSVLAISFLGNAEYLPEWISRNLVQVPLFNCLSKEMIPRAKLQFLMQFNVLMVPRMQGTVII